MTKRPATALVKNVHPEDIKAAIRKTGINFTGLAKKLGYHPTAITICLRQSWPSVEAGIAEHLGVTPQSLWPERYDAEGHPLSFPASKRSRARNRRHRQMSASA